MHENAYRVFAKAQGMKIVLCEKQVISSQSKCRKNKG